MELGGKCPLVILEIIEQALYQVDTSSQAGKAAVMGKTYPYIMSVPDPVAQSDCFRRMGDMLGIQIDPIHKEGKWPT